VPETLDAGVFQTQRPLLFSIAYRMLGSASDAEDVLQDAWLRFRGATEPEIRSPKAFAATIVTRLCLDRLKSARAAREQYVGPWLPEPVLTSGEEAPDAMLQRAESITLAFLVLLETLSPEERAVFLLREVFEYDHAEIAEILGVTAANARQLLHRAKARIAEGRPRAAHAPGSREARRMVAARFTAALRSGDKDELTRLLTEDVGLWSDGGGRVSASRRPLAGRAEVLNFLLGLRRVAVTTGAAHNVTVHVDEANGEPAILLINGGVLESVFVLSTEGGSIDGIRIVRNPEKLSYMKRQMHSAR
jgi:RNA polymerase sigma-70 factor (ECF subfamily)